MDPESAFVDLTRSLYVWVAKTLEFLFKSVIWNVLKKNEKMFKKGKIQRLNFETFSWLHEKKSFPSRHIKMRLVAMFFEKNHQETFPSRELDWSFYEGYQGMPKLGESFLVV